ncbi:helix-turn-helix domain-containing protein [Ruminiclostridium cellulolyticum]|uniref:DNA binding domain protein, excisionase family n=1 Tax=Ruminiclostridium cellulolyticum (strain ATCC 35319 / DSM 5812 / JCM 6584 / H10) TaxID=394503 RepID=B8I332_RUMCH|nr:helix-turn-helix domain-containing protein [Ruminiclostridium cellulolyticum]ACL76175.1 DNA binding domain protein, excisionase family [Ruminiclostridium cellulolyticum H10]
MNEEQVNEIINGQIAILEGINKLLALFTLEPLNDATNPILGSTEAAKLLGISKSTLIEGCNNKEIPFRKIGSKYIFSRVALMAWLHNVNMSYLFEKIEAVKKRNREKLFGGDEDPVAILNNYLRFTINPISGANENFKLEFSEAKEEKEKVDAEVAAALIGVSIGKMREIARGFLYNKIPISREGGKFMFPKEELLEWAETPFGKKIIEDYIKNKEITAKRREDADKRREEERLEKEAKKKARLKKKLNKSGVN